MRGVGEPPRRLPAKFACKFLAFRVLGLASSGSAEDHAESRKEEWKLSLNQVPPPPTSPARKGVRGFDSDQDGRRERATVLTPGACASDIAAVQKAVLDY